MNHHTRNSVVAIGSIMQLRFAGIACLAVLLSLLDAGPIDANTLAWKLSPGKQYVIRVERTIQQRVLDDEWSEVVQYQLRWTVESVDDLQRMNVSETLDHVNHLLTFPGGVRFEYDSRDDGEIRGDAASLARYWSGALSASRPFVLTPSGRRVAEGSAKGPRGAAEALAVPSTTDKMIRTDGPTTSKPAANASATVPSSEQDNRLSVSAKAGAARDWWSIPKPLLKLDLSLPTRDVQVDEHWTTDATVAFKQMADAVRLSVDYRYLGEQAVEGRRLDKIHTTLTVEPTGVESGAQPFVIDQHAGGGTIWFDRARGHLVRSERKDAWEIRLPSTSGKSVPVDVSASVNVQFQPLDADTTERPVPAESSER